MSILSRALVFLQAGMYALLGLPLFVASVALAPVFAWKVSPFVTMTIGAWCLGNAWLALVCAVRGQWRFTFTSQLYLWVFGLLEMAVVLAFRAKLVLGHPIAWLYLATLMLNLVVAVVGVFDWARHRPARTTDGPPVRLWHRAANWFFVVFVGFLALYGLLAPVGAPGTNGGIFPETLSAFTLRAFASFYLALTVGAVPLLWERTLSPLLAHGLAAYGLIVTITAAIVVYIGLFDLSARLGGLVYIGAYIGVGLVTLFALMANGIGGRAANSPRA